MSKTTESKVEIVDFTPEVAVNPYEGHVAALVEAGDGKATVITVPTQDAPKHKNYFAKAANAVGKTARNRVTVDNGDGTTSITITLTAKHAARRGKVGEVAEAE